MSYFPEIQVDLELLSLEARGIADLVVTVAPLPEQVPAPAPESRLGTDVMSYPTLLRARPRYEIRFDKVISYRVTAESCHAPDSAAEREGNSFCRFFKSNFLDFVETTSYGVDVHPGFRFHYGVYCMDTCIDVVCSTAPVVLSLAATR